MLKVVKITEKKPITQNEVLRLLDSSLFAGLVGIVMAIFALNISSLVLADIFGVCMVAEFVICVLAYVKAVQLRLRLGKLGQWKKLSLREQLDLHEWRKNAETSGN
ncbi:MAG: hypothetical protein ABSB71_07960 [Candidatus Bathyarchaeia archaeon]|jgi:5-bromo-4-chloroindolyl phosphate hydrolysis protein